VVAFFQAHIIEVFFIYGLSFFAMGLVIWIEASRSPEIEFSRALRPLGLFGLIHGSHEWFEMYLIFLAQLSRPTLVQEAIVITRLFLLASSFMMLIVYGSRLIIGPKKRRWYLGLVLATFGVYSIGLLIVLTSDQVVSIRYAAADVYTRYALAIPGAALTTWGLILQQRKLSEGGLQQFGNDLLLAALAFALYGGVGQSFSAPEDILKHAWLTTQTFINLFGFPVQVFRMLMACLIAVFIIRSLRAIEVMTSRQIEELRENKIRDAQKLHELNAELLHRTVRAQEAERQRVARELHDDTGQVLTALSLGLRGMGETIDRDPKRAIQQAKQLETLATTGLDNLQRMISGLHPPQLDDLGLMAALRWYAGKIRSQFSLDIRVINHGEKIQLSDDIRLTLFRIAQEAITNAARHSGCSYVSVEVKQYPSSVHLIIEDNGKGFEVQSILAQGKQSGCWGLIGMIERATLLGGECTILSQPGRGTRVEVKVPLVEQAANDEQ
jgi:signal transduction histidine kinase